MVEKSIFGMIVSYWRSPSQERIFFLPLSMCARIDLELKLLIIGRTNNGWIWIPYTHPLTLSWSCLIIFRWTLFLRIGWFGLELLLVVIRWLRLSFCCPTLLRLPLVGLKLRFMVLFPRSISFFGSIYKIKSLPLIISAKEASSVLIGITFALVRKKMLTISLFTIPSLILFGLIFCIYEIWIRFFLIQFKGISLVGDASLRTIPLNNFGTSFYLM